VLVVNGTELYHEVRGDGPPVLLIMGATGDAGHFERFADLLADEFAVVSYDRRGNGRSPRPPGWSATSAADQADDAAALLAALDLSPAAVFGTSLGGVIALCLLLRHPQMVRGAILHEPAFWPLFDDGIVSCRVGLLKPEPAMFERLLTQYALQAGDTIFIDDLQANIDAAAALGMSAIRFTGANECGRALRALPGVRF